MSDIAPSPFVTYRIAIEYTLKHGFYKVKRHLLKLTWMLLESELISLFWSKKGCWNTPTILISQNPILHTQWQSKVKTQGNLTVVFRMRTEYVQFRKPLLSCWKFNDSQRHKGPWKQRLSIQDGLWIPHGQRGRNNPRYQYPLLTKFLNGLAIYYPLSLRQKGW